MKGIRIISSAADFSNIAINEEMYSLTSIVIVTNPNKMRYSLNEQFDSTGMKVAAIYTNTYGSKKIILSDDEWSYQAESAFTTLGRQQVTISYQNLSTFLTIRVTESTNLDIASEFNWTKNRAIIASTGLLNTTTQIMQASDAVNVAGAQTLKISFMKWTSATGAASSYGLAFYGSDDSYVGGYTFPIADSSLGNSAGSSYTLEISIPDNASYIKTTYHQNTSQYGDFAASLSFTA